jgi:sulfate permease, SulP family
MAYAGIAGVPPQRGLYSALVGMFVYAIFGTSRQLAVTSTSSSAAMLAALVAPLAAVNSARYMLLVSAVMIAAGFLFLLGGVLKLGVVSEFISKPVLKGFVFGLALTIIVKQAHNIPRLCAAASSGAQRLTCLNQMRPKRERIRDAQQVRTTGS